MTHEPVNMPLLKVSLIWSRQRSINRHMVKSFITALIFVFSIGLPPATVACGWWGDAENDSDSESIVIDKQGHTLAGSSQASDSPEALTRQANRLRQYGNPGFAGAARLYKLAAQRGYAPAQNNLGAMYEDGLGVVPDLAEAARWYHLAAKQGEAHAQHSLGVMLLSGRGVKKNSEKGIYWIHQAANQGHASACADLGRFYTTGNYLKRNSAKAIYWWKKAQQSGYPDADKEVGALISSDAHPN